MLESRLEYQRYKHYYASLLPLVSSREVKAYSMVILSLFALAFFGFFAILPTLSTVAGLKRQISDNELLEKKLQEKINSLSLAQFQYEKISRDLPLVEKALPDNPNLSPFLLSLENVKKDLAASFSGVSFGNLDLLPPATNSGTLNTLPLRLNFSAPYHKIIRLLSALRNMERIVLVDRLTLSAEKTKEENIQTEVSAGIFYLK